MNEEEMRHHHEVHTLHPLTLDHVDKIKSQSIRSPLPLQVLGSKTSVNFTEELDSLGRHTQARLWRRGNRWVWVVTSVRNQW